MTRLVSPCLAGSGIVLMILVSLSCAGRRPYRPGGLPAATMGVYRVTLETEGERRKFRLLLFAAEPDRLHGEAISPIGRTELIVDGGAGRLAVSIPRERRAFVGEAGPGEIEKLLGVPLTLRELVSALLGTSGAPRGPVVAREPADEPGLPERLVLAADGGARLELRLLDLRPLRTSTEQLGSGAAAPGLEIRPLAELGRVDWPQEASGSEVGAGS